MVVRCLGTRPAPDRARADLRSNASASEQAAPRAGEEARPWRPRRSRRVVSCSAPDRICDSTFQLRTGDLTDDVADDATTTVEEIRLGQASESVVVIRAAAAVADGH